MLKNIFEVIKKNKYAKIGFVLIVAIFVFAVVGFAGKGLGSNKERKIVYIGSSGGESGNSIGIVAIAKELGYIQEEFDKVGYDVEFMGFAGGVAVNEALATGKIDLATEGDVPTAVGIANHIGLTWIGVNLGAYDHVIVVEPDSEIQSFNDLEGKNIGFGLGSASQYIYESALVQYGVDKDKIEVLNIGGTNALNALTSGEMDATVQLEFDARISEKKGESRVLLTSSDIGFSSQDMIIGRTDFLEENPQAAVALHKALIRAREEFKKNPEKYYVTLSAQKIEEYPELGEVLFDRDGGEFTNLISGISEDNLKREQKLENFLFEVGRTSNTEDISQYCDNSYYEQAVKELGINE